MTGHLFYKRAALALMALFAALAMTLLPADGGKVSHAQTPTSSTLVSNTGQTLTGSTYGLGSARDAAQRFATGSSRGGYTLTSIDIILNSVAGGTTDLAMTLHSGSANGTKVADFAGPSSLTAGNATYTFTPTAALSLDAFTRYWIVLQEPTTTVAKFTETTSSSEDTGSAARWLIANELGQRAASSTGAYEALSSGGTLPIDVKGYANPFTPASSLVSNIEQGDYLVANVNTQRAQAFTTGYNSTGYTVDAVEIDYRDTDGDGVVVNICETNADETPNQTATTCWIFTSPGSFTVGRLPYDAPDDLTLDPATTYTVVFTYSGTGNLELGGTSSRDEDASSLAGWSIRDKFHNQLADDRWDTPGSVRSIRIDIEGTPKAPVANSPTAIDSAVSTSINMAHTFSASHFNFRATTSGDTLSKVHILTLPNRGTLALSGTAVTAGDAITRAQLNAGNLKFTPVTDRFGDGYASFDFRVEGSSLESTDGNQMTIDVTATTLNLVSNTQQGSEHGVNVNTRRAQAFTTGYNSTGYVISEVQVISTDAEGDEFAVSICGTGTDDIPVTPCTSLDPPDSFAAGALTFTPPIGFELDSETIYTLTMMTPNDSGAVSMKGTNSADEDASSLAGWSIRDSFHQRPDTTWVSISSVRSFRIAIEGIAKSPVAGAPTSTDHTVETVENTAHTFSAAHFNFMANTSGDALSKVHILTLPDEGTLALSGVVVAAGDEISKTDIDDGNLKFTPDTGETGQGYASFDSRVEGSSHKSTNGYRMTIDVRTEHDSVPPALAATDPRCWPPTAKP